MPQVALVAIGAPTSDGLTAMIEACGQGPVAQLQASISNGDDPDPADICAAGAACIVATEAAYSQQGICGSDGDGESQLILALLPLLFPHLPPSGLMPPHLLFALLHQPRVHGILAVTQLAK